MFMGGETVRHHTPYAMVAMDLDGTALQPDGTVSPALRTAVAACVERGIAVILATGRMPQPAQHYWEVLHLPPCPIIAYQGAMVIWMPGGLAESQIALPEQAARRAVTWALEQNLLVQVYVGSELWVSRDDSRVLQHIEPSHASDVVRVRGSETLLDWPEAPIKVLLQGESAVLDRVRGELEELLRLDPVRLLRSHSDFLEVVHRQAGKSAGLRVVARALGVASERVLAIGDAENDIDMLKWAGFGVAMGQAPESVKRAANAVAETVERDGAARAIERWVLGSGQ